MAERAGLQALNSLRLRASATLLRTPDTQAGLRDVLDEARSLQLPVVVLGEGSNVVLAGDLDALVLRYRGLGREIISEGSEHVGLRVAAGENWHALTVWALDQGFYGLENLALIPGTVGAAPIQNIGAYGVELSEFIDCVEVVDIDSGSMHRLSAAACAFGYRDSIFKGALRDRCVITAVEMTLRRSEQPNLSYAALADYVKADGHEVTASEVHQAVVELRRARLPDPSLMPNVGSFFKNPVVTSAQAEALMKENPSMPVFRLADGSTKIPAAWLIEACGWKGYTQSGVGVHGGHALVLINQGSNSGSAVLDLAGRIQQSVRRRFGCKLEIEPRIYGAAA
ncbi:UDP-N-acetylmuramate dehydrogenase [Chromatocurvus halotolerans]|uniref:UDP-N-acetylenolpyruvoylglucosamine reductase n=1 Tax=Chromatocurvus halotolerans TaxID=1132028 RepID=A0A4R2KSG2_9GAMM|nr:UDP-N-acetylmuramate dehydrogenase [Chromatocurvus halotolerans]TCO75732.1 UDP-N-acetylmuramate dehydrogenase [Chromatocurvus halotolerans]